MTYDISRTVVIFYLPPGLYSPGRITKILNKTYSLEVESETFWFQNAIVVMKRVEDAKKLVEKEFTTNGLIFDTKMWCEVKDQLK